MRAVRRLRRDERKRGQARTPEEIRSKVSLTTLPLPPPSTGACVGVRVRASSGSGHRFPSWPPALLSVVCTLDYVGQTCSTQQEAAPTTRSVQGIISRGLNFGVARRYLRRLSRGLFPPASSQTTRVSDTGAAMICNDVTTAGLSSLKVNV